MARLQHTIASGFSHSGTVAIPSHGSIQKDSSVTQSGVARWTNASVLRFADDEDPIQKMEEKVRALVLRAKDAGWSGPPFSPITLAKFLNIPVDPTTSVVDARTIPSAGGVRIQYNPQQARERARFSIAHEIAHALFDDVADATRHRGGDPAVTDDWQLEMLCNIAASEIVMPAGSLPTRLKTPAIEDLLRERLAYDVSVEAYLLRTVKVAAEPMTMFVASPRHSGPQTSYSIDYAVPSPNAPRLNIRGKRVPAESSVLHCIAIGATSHATESWLTGASARFETVGISGYPGSPLPRVACLIRHEHSEELDVLEFVQGNVLEPRPFPPEIICQLTNDKAVRWGGGVSKQSAKRYPAAEAEYSEWIKSVPKARRLGEVHFARIADDRTIASIVAQEGFGPTDVPRIRYQALDKGLIQLAQYARTIDASVHMPRIGTGVAGGEWPLIEDTRYVAGNRQARPTGDPKQRRGRRRRCTR